MDYSYEIKDDAESDFTQLATNIEHAFANSIPSNNAKKLNFQMDIPSGVSPTNGVRVKVRLKMTFTEA
jgi:NAD(P)H-hydrate repair Nnr-like enzyme with NAD(P)H-hydrate epimerase domain